MNGREEKNVNELQTFNFESEEVRTLTISGEPWFVGRDVAAVLGYSNSRKALADHVEEEDKTDGVTIRDSIGREQSPTLINESGLYSLIFSSKQERAKSFKRWVTSEVLPALRKSGTYTMPGGQVGSTRVIDKLAVVEAAARMLNMNDASKILMLGRFCKQEGMPSDFLPFYEDNGGRQLIAASTLLKELGLGMSAVKFNKLLMDAGYLEERERPSSSKEGKTKKFKALTEKGLEYGENQISAQNPREVQPLYYKDTFKDLFDAVAGE